MSVKYALLAQLYQQSMHGYELSKQIPLTLKGDWEVSPGQVASTLQRLEKANLVAYTLQPVEDAPDRKVYHLTDAGLRELEEWLTTPEVRDYRLGDAFYVKLVFSLTGAPVSPETIIRSQRRRLFQELHDVTALRETLEPRVDLPLILLLETAIMHLDADLRWLEMCEARLPELKAYEPLSPQPLPRGRPRRETDPNENEDDELDQEP